MITITGSVGKNGKNNAPDIKTIQMLLNASDSVTPIAVDHRYGPVTFKAILQYQMSVFPSEKDWDGLIGRHGKTLRALANPSTRVTRLVRSADANAQAIKLGGFRPSKKVVVTIPTATPLRNVGSTYEGLSGVRWCSEFPGSTSTADLASPFRENMQKFIAALVKAGIRPTVTSTFRPLERAWLMHWAFNIAHGYDPTKVPARAGIKINWLHMDARGNYDEALSKKAAVEMNLKYRSIFKPSLTSLHISGNAIDMGTSWSKPLSIVDGKGLTILLPTGNGAESRELHRVGASFGVFKLVNDAPHWSSSGR